ncbi:peptidase domain-containing ABC transporter [Lysinibacillus sphaericus]|uniref:peptidase domain-containing ABC transporter n=1 Tax=Lysinibacillus sphaericus TaxID=1421 RepID=UPI000C17FF5E|nr:peptidase domain-containing ABC transporter [Lysinibacillus sphaericus]MDM5353048.1 peptidase domain-containing ABC transporter [Lysinibacillus sphaericus]MEB7454785.1 peptidase domain-containing ABC transporter [Lysinibacillus sphaericus]PIJ98647.1 bacteriocin ABC transporter ATP-binding protein [Lysinibacillus sphaericus]QIC47722.1 peptidase domain-containing ABC transporter [Lysinibacillus sphaericus]
MFKRYVCVKQHDQKDCGIACLSTISKQYGLKIPISKLREVAGTDKQGTNVLGLIKAAEELGFTAKAVKGDAKALFQEFPLPAIAHCVVDGKLLHYVVIHKITQKEVIIADPAKGIVKYTPEDFLQIWTGVLVLLVPSIKFERGDETQGLFARFFHLLKPQKWLFFQIFICSILYTLLGIAGAFYFQLLIDDILVFNLEKSLHIISLGVLLLYTFQIILDAFRNYLLLHISQKFDISLILNYYSHVINLPMNFFSTRKVGEIISRIMDASKVREALSGATLTIVLDTMMVIVGAVILYTQSAFLFGITLVMVPVYILIVWLFKKTYENINRREMEENAQLNAYLVESLNGVETIKAYNAEKATKDELEKRFIKFLKSIFKHGLIDNYQNSLKNYLGLVSGTVILWVGSYQVLRGNMTAGQLIAFNALLAYFLTPLQNLVNLQPMLQSAIVASQRLGEILDLETEEEKHKGKRMVPQHLKGDIDIRNVDFRYGTRSLILKDMNLSIGQGEKVAFVGESGSGKTTLAKLLLNFYQPEKGEILINGNNIQDLDFHKLREKIAYVSQESFFFSGTIEENLSLGTDNDVTLEDIVSAAKIAKAHDFINTLPLRYSTVLEENASNLSGGQRQRLSIARAILKRPDILILDEATSNLDSITEKAISETIDDYCSGITTIIIAHRLSTIKKCDKICVIEQGQIIELGTHEELLNSKGRYYELWRNQIAGGNEQIELVTS